MNKEAFSPAQQLAEYMTRIYEKELTTTSGGNLSILDGNGDLWITPSGVDKGSLTAADMICVKPDGTCIGKHKASLELPFHRMIYKARPDLRAVLHAHPAALTAFAMVRRCPDLDLMPQLRQLCPRVGLAAYAVPGSETLGSNIAKCFSEGSDAVILENHGVCVGGTDMAAAFRCFESLNHLAKVQLLAGKAGNLRPRTCGTEQKETVGSAPAGDARLAGAAMVKILRRACRHGLFTTALGVCSMALPGGKLLLTPSDRDLELLEPEDLLVVEADAHFHGSIYAKNPAVGAVLQASPAHAMAYAVTDGFFDTQAVPESYVLLRQVPRLPYGDLETVADRLDAKHPAALVENRCFVVTGKDLTQAFDRLEVVDATAHALLDAASLGTIVRITPEEEVDLKKTYGLDEWDTQRV